MNEAVFIMRCWNDTTSLDVQEVWRFRVISESDETPKYFASLRETMAFIESRLGDSRRLKKSELKE